jgi:hypothetical protein
MFHPLTVPGGNRNQPLRFPLAFLAQFLIVAFAILVFVMYVAGVPMG